MVRSLSFLLVAVLIPVGAAALEVDPPVLVSETLSGTGLALCGSPHFARGSTRFLTFVCLDPVVPDDTNEHTDVHLIDRSTGIVERVSVTSDGAEIRFDSFEGFPSDDGRLVAFESRGPMHPDATQPPGWVSPNAFLRDRLLGQTTFVSPDAAGQVPFFPVTLRDADLSRSEVLLQTRQQLLDPLGNPLPSQSNLYLRNWDTGTIELVSVAVDGGLGDNASTLGRIVTGGRYVIFQSAATNLPAAPEAGFNLYVRDRQSATTTRISRPWHGGEFETPFNLDLAPPACDP